ncbi:hypothetical protein XENORESO_004492 [Xenotaenia resolanae]|uniref:NADH dehydrogenase subunit 6 n=1 Tax=Xenotaenia resolanae TaxID=208358 RepID=A0ABV0WVI9_9TELE
MSSPPLSLLVVGVSISWCIGGSRCPRLGALVCAGSLPEAAGWIPWDSPLLFSGGVVVVLAVVLPGFPCSWVPWMSVAQISSISVSGPGGWVCGPSHSLLHIFMEKPYIHKCAHTNVWMGSGGLVVREQGICVLERPQVCWFESNSRPLWVPE